MSGSMGVTNGYPQVCPWATRAWSPFQTQTIPARLLTPHARPGEVALAGMVSSAVLRLTEKNPSKVRRSATDTSAPRVAPSMTIPLSASYTSRLYLFEEYTSNVSSVPPSMLDVSVISTGSWKKFEALELDEQGVLVLVRLQPVACLIRHLFVFREPIAPIPRHRANQRRLIKRAAHDPHC
jgi:hypothetical protein